MERHIDPIILVLNRMVGIVLQMASLEPTKS